MDNTGKVATQDEEIKNTKTQYNMHWTPLCACEVHIKYLTSNDYGYIGLVIITNTMNKKSTTTLKQIQNQIYKWWK